MRILSRVAALAVLAMLGILLVFFFPAHCGSFTATHGPATAFRALAAARRLFACISAALMVAASRIAVKYLQGALPAAAELQPHAALFAMRC